MKKLAFHLPQYHLFDRNELWWGRGFTEWTNVTKAKPLYQGHYQPKLPTETGFYDLLNETSWLRQCELRNRAGIDGFIFWTYWHSPNLQLMDKALQVYMNTLPSDMFAVAWANHDWAKKTWDSRSKDVLLSKQEYGGGQFYRDMFDYYNKTYFQKKGYIKTNNCPLFVVWKGLEIPNFSLFINTFNECAKAVGFSGIRWKFIAYSGSDVAYYDSKGVEFIYDPFIEAFSQRKYVFKVINRIGTTFFGLPKFLPYEYYAKVVNNYSSLYTDCILIPNFDHSPRSHNRAKILSGSHPSKWEKLLKKYMSSRVDREFVFIRSWNEWGEGNYLEPCIKYKNKFIEATWNGLVSQQ